MPVLWTSEEAATATGGKATKSWQAHGVSIDSRQVSKGDLFIALKGETFDGHSFVLRALEDGAAAAVVTHIPEGVFPDSPLLIVNDTAAALWDLGLASRKRTSAKIIGVTGSVGKTSTKELAKLALSILGKTYATAGNLNNHFGAPLSLSRMEKDTKFGVFEMGMNHAGEISKLTKLIRPDAAIITTVEPVHLEFFDSVADIAKAKSEIFEGMTESGMAVLNIDNPYYRIMKEAAAKRNIGALTFGEDKNADFRLVSYEDKGEVISVKVSYKGKEFSYDLGAKGKHSALNSLGVLGIVAALGEDFNKVLPIMASYTPAKGRGQVFKVNVEGKNITLIDDSYNASPASMRAAFEVLAGNRKSGKRIVAALGDMRELGQAAPELHASLAKDIIARNIDIIFTAGDLMHNLYAALPEAKKGRHYKNSAEMAEEFFKEVKDGDIIMLKGSNGTRMFDVVAALKGEKKINAH